MAGSQNIKNDFDEREAFANKIKEWQGLGFDTSELEAIFESDFERFKKEHNALLRKQIDARKIKSKDMNAKGVTIAPSDEREHTKMNEPSEEEAETIVIASIPEREIGKGEMEDIEHSIDDKVAPKNMKDAAVAKTDEKAISKTQRTKTNMDSKTTPVKSASEKNGNVKTKESKKFVGNASNDTQNGNGVEEESIGDIEIVRTDEAMAGKDEGITEKVDTQKQLVKTKKVVKAEDGPEKGKGKGPTSMRKGMPEKGSRKNMIVAGVVAAVVIIAIFGGMLVMQKTGPSIALSISTSNPEIGENVTINASIKTGSGKIAEYEWDFGDGTSSRSMGAKAWHIYQRVGKFTIRLTVKDENGLGDKKDIELTVKAEPFSVPAKKYGDKVLYDLETYGFIEGAYGKPLYQITIPGTGLIQPKTIDILSVSTNGVGTASDEVKRIPDRIDGYGVAHKTYEDYVEQSSVITGGIQTNALADPIPFAGTSSAKTDAYCDLTTNTTIQQWSNTSNNVHMNEFGQTINLESVDSLNSYPNMLKADEQFKPEMIYPASRKFDAANPATLSGDVNCGAATYHWQMEGADSVAGMPTLKFNITLDEDTMALNSMNVFYMTIWIGNDFSMPLKSIVHSEGVVEGNEYTATVVMVARSFESGTDAIEWGSCDADHNWESYSEFFDYDEAFQNFSVVPPAGGVMDSFSGFSPQDAYNYAIARNGTFASWKEAHQYAYAIEANYSIDSHGHGQWNVTFGEAGSSSGYRIFVQRDPAGNYIAGEFDEKAISGLGVNVNYSLLKNRKMLTINATEQILANRTNAAGGTGKLDLTTAWFKCSVDVPFPSTDVTSILTRTGNALYGYMLEKRDGMSYGVSAENGQLMYAWKHSGQSLGI